MNSISVQSRPVVLAVEENEVERTSKRNKNNQCCGYSTVNTYQPACSKGFKGGFVQQGYQQGIAAPAASSSSYAQGQFQAPIKGAQYGQIKG
ncbi:MAG TPA: hypothetical protein VFH51_12945 [Myxococcota bacterium]|nr:hypothetical protein [Myxococcota bacterium]